MSNVQRLEIEQSSFYTDAVVLITCTPKEVSKNVEWLAKKYSISKEAVYWRVRSRYGDKLANVRNKYRQPTRESFLRTILLSKDTDELRERLGLTNWEFSGIFDRLLGVSTFSAAKTIALAELDIVKYNPSIRDNQSLIYGMRLGDGSYDYRKKAMRIEHGYKQRDWLIQKVAMLKQSYPYINDEVKEQSRSFGTTYRWYSRKLQGSAVTYNEVDKVEMARNLNALGLFVLFMDDGNLGRYGNSATCGFAVETLDIGEALQQTLKSYGYLFKVETDNYIVLKRQADIQSFLNDFIRPFRHLTPECMLYKTILKV